MKFFSSPDTPLAVKAAAALFGLNGVVWLALGLASLLRLAASPNPAQLIIAGLIFGNAGAMFVTGAGLAARRRWFFFLALAVLAVNLLLTITDQFGLIDFVTLIIDAVLLGLLVITRAELLGAGRPPAR